MSVKIFVLSHSEARRRAIDAIQSAPDGFVVKITEPTRSLEQNAALWALLHDISEQVEWYGKYLSPEDWKTVLTAGLNREQRVERGLDGGFVMLGASTRSLSKREFSDLLEFSNAFAAEHGVTRSHEP
jgi:hypothetical protein